MISSHIVLGGNNWTLDIELETELVTSDTYTADPNWKFTDAAGHEHYYSGGYPTLRLIVDKQHWCNGNEGISPHDSHWQVDESHMVCLRCKERIEPRQLPPGSVTSIVLGTRALLEGSRSDIARCRVKLLLNESECQQIVHAVDRDATVQTLIDSLPHNRFHSIEIGGH